MNRWKEVALGAIADSIDYGVTASATLQPLGPQFLRITDIQEGAVNWSSVPWCECDERTAREARLKPGDIVFARTGATTGKSFLLRECPANAVFASYLIRVRLRDLIEPRYVGHYFQTPAYWAQISKSARGAAQPGVNATILRSLELPLPPLTEQRRIADVLDQAEALRAKRRVALAELATLSRAIFHEICGDPATNPRHWPTVSLAELVRTDDSINYGVVQPGDDLDEGVPLIRVGDLHDGQIRSSGLKRISPSIESNYKRSRLCGDEILLSCVGSIGMVVLADESLKGFNIARAVTRIRLSDKVNRVYVAKYLESAFVQNYFTKELRTVSQPTLNIKQIAETEVRLPPYEVQQAFARRIAVVEKLKETHRSSLAELDSLFSSLQHRAFRGEL